MTTQSDMRYLYSNLHELNPSQLLLSMIPPSKPKLSFASDGLVLSAAANSIKLEFILELVTIHNKNTLKKSKTSQKDDWVPREALLLQKQLQI